MQVVLEKTLLTSITDSHEHSTVKKAFSLERFSRNVVAPTVGLLRKQKSSILLGFQARSEQGKCLESLSRGGGSSGCVDANTFLIAQRLRNSARNAACPVDNGRR